MYAPRRVRDESRDMGVEWLPPPLLAPVNRCPSGSTLAGPIDTQFLVGGPAIGAIRRSGADLLRPHPRRVAKSGAAPADHMATGSERLVAQAQHDVGWAAPQRVGGWRSRWAAARDLIGRRPVRIVGALIATCTGLTYLAAVGSGATLGAAGAGLVTLAAAAGLGAVLTGRRHPRRPQPARAPAPDRAIVAAMLGPLERLGYVVLRDRGLAGTRGVLDYLVVGPTGVWLLTARQWAGAVSVEGDAVAHDGAPLDALLARCRRDAAAVRRLLRRHPAVASSAVHPVLWVHGAAVQRGWGSSPVVDGVRVCSARTLLRRITRAAEELDGVTVARLVRLLDRSLPAVGEPAATHPARG